MGGSLAVKQADAGIEKVGGENAGLTGKGSLIVLSADGQGDGVVPASVGNGRIGIKP
jgi:hypothetical protein